MAYENILYDKPRSGVLITLNRPERMNALSSELRAELHEAFDEAVEDPDVRAIVLTGAGRAFSAGADLGGGGEGRQVPPWTKPQTSRSTFRPSLSATLRFARDKCHRQPDARPSATGRDSIAGSYRAA